MENWSLIHVDYGDLNELAYLRVIYWHAYFSVGGLLGGRRGCVTKGKI